MNHTAAERQKKPFGSRAAATLFLFAIIGIAGAGLEWLVMRPAAEAADNKAQLAAARLEAQNSIPRLDPDTEEKLSTPDLSLAGPSAVAFDPFVDRAGISGAKANGAAAKLGAPKQPAADPNAPPPVPDLSARAASWRAEADRADKARTNRPPRASMFLVSEVSPYGKMGPRGREDVLFRLESTKGELAARVGTPFYDGVLVGTNEDGVVFRTKAGTTRIVKWSRRRESDEKLQPTSAPTGANNTAQSAPPSEARPNR